MPTATLNPTARPLPNAPTADLDHLAKLCEGKLVFDGSGDALWMRLPTPNIAHLDASQPLEPQIADALSDLARKCHQLASKISPPRKSPRGLPTLSEEQESNVRALMSLRR